MCPVDGEHGICEREIGTDLGEFGAFHSKAVLVESKCIIGIHGFRYLTGDAGIYFDIQVDIGSGVMILWCKHRDLSFVICCMAFMIA